MEATATREETSHRVVHNICITNYTRHMGKQYLGTGWQEYYVHVVVFLTRV